MPPPMKSSRLRCLLLSLFLPCVLSSCGTEFRKAWNEPVPCAVAAPPGSSLAYSAAITQNNWDGTWHSDASGHHGRLQCVIKGPLNKEGDHTFFYRATWMKILSGTYKATHRVVKEMDGSLRFKGEHKMPDWAGGLYQYDGVIKDGEFKADYKSSADHGTYTMKSVTP